MDWRRLLHRWFVEYNPLYLLSAALVIRGVNVVSRELLHAGHVYAELGGPALAELYAWALIGGAALLSRIGLRRPAVMLSMIAVLYQCDLTLHTETCALLGWVGWLASGLWLASFVLKLLALARAMRLRLSRSAIAVPALGAAGLVVVPRIVQSASAHGASIVVGAWTFAIFAVAISTARRVETTSALDAWGKTVLRRALAATWAIWALAAFLHVAFWLSIRPLEPAVLVPVPLLLFTHFARRKEIVWATVGGTLALVFFTSPAFFAFAAALSSITLAAHARRNRSPAVLVGVLACAWLCAWTASWSGGSLPPHVLWLDAVLACALALCVWRLRAWSAIAVLSATLSHWAIQARIVTPPVTALEWGVWSVGIGFALLAFTLGATLASAVSASSWANAREEPPP